MRDLIRITIDNRIIAVGEMGTALILILIKPYTHTRAGFAVLAITSHLHAEIGEAFFYLLHHSIVPI